MIGVKPDSVEYACRSLGHALSLMDTTIFIYYRGRKFHSFRTLERALVYMDANRDLEDLGLPRPSQDNYAYSGQTGVVKCWFPKSDLVRVLLSLLR